MRLAGSRWWGACSRWTAARVSRPLCFPPWSTSCGRWGVSPGPDPGTTPTRLLCVSSWTRSCGARRARPQRRSPRTPRFSGDSRSATRRLCARCSRRPRWWTPPRGFFTPRRATTTTEESEAARPNAFRNANASRSTGAERSSPSRAPCCRARCPRCSRRRRRRRRLPSRTPARRRMPSWGARSRRTCLTRWWSGFSRTTQRGGSSRWP